MPAARGDVATGTGQPTVELPLRTSSQTPTGRELHALLEDSIAGISELNRVPLASAAPSAIGPAPEAPTPSGANAAPSSDGQGDGRASGEIVVPIETLLYRGPRALARAQELRDQLRRVGGPNLPAPLAELFDLLDLAAAE
jgi:hypothetical protein